MIKMIGYWISSFEDVNYIAPQELVTEWPERTKERVVEYLNGGRLLTSYLGRSWCRFVECEQNAIPTETKTEIIRGWFEQLISRPFSRSRVQQGKVGRQEPVEGVNNMGSAEFTDGVWAWPAGLVHYVLKHDVRLPEEFISHVLTNAVVPRSNEWPSQSPSTDVLDHSLWIVWCKQHGSRVVGRRIDALRAEADRALELAESEAVATFEAQCRKLELELGLAAERCLWRSCQNQALQGRALCAMHCEQEALPRDLSIARALVLSECLGRALGRA